ncbi:hypothetical protein ACVOMV_06095 [Mesorhizobium atlanticum]
MQRLPQEELRIGLGTGKEEQSLDNQTALRLKRKLAEDFRVQLTLGMPNNADEAGLHRLAAQLKSKQVTVRLFLRHPLHAKLYLLSDRTRTIRLRVFWVAAILPSPAFRSRAN